jgi:nicotinic acid mononucleotide adenylyltransferase
MRSAFLAQVIAEDEQLVRNRSNIEIVRPSVTNDVSSTVVRRLLKQKRSIKYLVPDLVCDYIQRHQLQNLPAWQ